MFNKFAFLVLSLVILPLGACADTNSPYKEGEHFVELPKPVSTVNPDKVEIVELFWYGCPHCYGLEPLLNDWLKTVPEDVEFVRMPALMARGWESHGRAYYTAEVLGVVDKTHKELFTAIHRERQQLMDQISLAAFYARHGVDEVDFNKTYNSFAVNSRVQQAVAKQRGYRATGVPAVIVNGKYRVGTTMKAGAKGMFDVIDWLIEQELKSAQN